MDAHTFGDAKAAVNLVRILNEEENFIYRRKSCNILSKYLSSIKIISSISDEMIRRSVLGI